MNKCIVKITIGDENDYFRVGEVVYYRSGMTPDFVVRWLWYFEYIQALIKVHNPKRNVSLIRAPQNILLGKEWHEHRRLSLIKSKQSKLKKLQMGVVDDDLFHFKSQENEKKIEQVKKQIEALERDEHPIEEFPEYINKIKKYVKGGNT